MIARRKFIQSLLPGAAALVAAAAIARPPASPETEWMTHAKARAELGITDPDYTHTIIDLCHQHPKWAFSIDTQSAFSKGIA